MFVIYLLELNNRLLNKHRQASAKTRSANTRFWICLEWLKDERIDAKFYLNPLHPYVADAYEAKRLAEFKQKIIEMSGGGGGIRNCTDVLSRDDINRQFYDYKHFRPEAGGGRRCNKMRALIHKYRRLKYLQVFYNQPLILVCLYNKLLHTNRYVPLRNNTACWGKL